MATLCRAYSSEAGACRALEGLRTVGLPPQGAQLITGGPLHDLRRESIGDSLGRAELPAGSSLVRVEVAEMGPAEAAAWLENGRLAA